MNKEMFIMALQNVFPQIGDDVTSVCRADAFTFERGNCKVNFWNLSKGEEYKIEIKIKKDIITCLQDTNNSEKRIEEPKSLIHPDVQFVLEAIEKAYQKSIENNIS